MAISVNTMRAIDHWIGVPLCALISPVVALIDAVKNALTPSPPSPKKLLFIELSEMGSAILVDPAMRNAQARGAELYFLIFKSNRASLTLLNTVKPENIFTIDSSSISGLLKDTLSFLVHARRHRIDTVIATSQAPDSRIMQTIEDIVGNVDNDLRMLNWIMREFVFMSKISKSITFNKQSICTTRRSTP